MKPDQRDTLFVFLFEEHLHPLGFRRRGRKAIRTLDGGLTQHVELESSTWNHGGYMDFGINLLVRHSAFVLDPFSERSPPEQGDMLVCISLRNYAHPPRHRWSISQAGDNNEELQQVRDSFSEVGVPLLARMSALASIEALCAEFAPHRYFEARSWCLRRLGRKAESAAVIREAYVHAPHEGLRSHAARLLARYGD